MEQKVVEGVGGQGVMVIDKVETAATAGTAALQLVDEGTVGRRERMPHPSLEVSGEVGLTVGVANTGRDEDVRSHGGSKDKAAWWEMCAKLSLL